MIKKPEIKLERYTHFKSDKKEYEVLGLVFDTDKDVWKVLYKALYDASKDFGEGGVLFTRSMKDFFGEVEVNGKMVKRFNKI